MSTTVEPSKLSPADQKRVSELRVLFTSAIQSKIARITLGDKCVDLPDVTLRLVEEAIENLAEGRSVTLVTEDEAEDEISPQEAASILGVSRPFASKLFDEGAIPCRRVGTHRRALRGDVVAYRERERGGEETRAGRTRRRGTATQPGVLTDGRPDRRARRLCLLPGGTCGISS
jgi:excisionase family DNA binding protein